MFIVQITGILFGITGLSYCLLRLRDDIIDVNRCYAIKVAQEKALREDRDE